MPPGVRPMYSAAALMSIGFGQRRRGLEPSILVRGGREKCRENWPKPHPRQSEKLRGLSASASFLQVAQWSLWPMKPERPSSVKTHSLFSQGGLWRMWRVWPHSKSATQSPRSSLWNATIARSNYRLSRSQAGWAIFAHATSLLASGLIPLMSICSV